MSTNRNFLRAAQVSECSRTQCDAIEQYVAERIGPVSFVIHEDRSTLVHVDVHVVAPEPERPFWFLFTTGMSARPMSVPSGYGVVPHAELSLMLPEWWQVDLARWRSEPRWYWPVRELISAARYPHRQRTWLGDGHTLTNADPPKPFDASTKLAATLLLDGMLDDELCAIHADVRTRLLLLLPIHSDELAFKRAHGFEALRDRLRAADVDVIVDPDRESCIASSSLAVG